LSKDFYLEVPDAWAEVPVMRGVPKVDLWMRAKAIATPCGHRHSVN
jgi:hypothetical protein